MRKITIYSRLTALMTVLLLLPALAFSMQDNKSPEYSTGSITVGTQCRHTELVRFVTLAYPEEFLPSRNTHQLRNQTRHSTSAPRSDTLYFKRSQFCFQAVCILYVILWFLGKSVSYSQRFIIRYIHDQDGRKGKASAF